MFSEENILKCFNDEELSNEVLRFFPKSIIISEISNEELKKEKTEFLKSQKDWFSLDVRTLKSLTIEEGLDLIKEDEASIIFIESLKPNISQVNVLRNEEFIKNNVINSTSIYGCVIQSRELNHIVKNKTIGILNLSYPESSYKNNSLECENNSKIINIPLLVNSSD